MASDWCTTPHLHPESPHHGLALFLAPPFAMAVRIVDSSTSPDYNRLGILALVPVHQGFCSTLNCESRGPLQR